MFHTVGYYESADQAGAYAAIAAMQDQSLFVIGDDVRVPDDLPNVMATAFLSAATTVLGAQLRSPTLRTLANYQIEPLVNADDFPSIPPVPILADNPLALKPGENLSFWSQTDNTGAVALQGLVWLCDGPIQAQAGEIFSVGATSTITLVAGNWVNGAITFTQDLPNGTYAVVGMRARGTNLQCARIVFPGGKWRPGVPAINTVGDDDQKFFRNGRAGVFGTFEETNQFSIDALGHTDSAQSYVFDLIKVG